MRTSSRLKPRAPSSFKELQRKHVAPLVRKVPTRDGSVLAVPLSWLCEGGSGERYARTLLAEPHRDDDPYSELGGSE